MSKKTSADVLIGGRIYTLCGYESEEYLQKVASYINNKINEYDGMEKFRRLPVEMKTALVELNIADDYFKAREQAEKLDQDVKEKEKEIYELKHEIISARIKVESSEKITAELEKENQKLLLQKAKLEASLEDALLGKIKGLNNSQNSSQNPEMKSSSDNKLDFKDVLNDNLETEDTFENEEDSSNNKLNFEDALSDNLETEDTFDSGEDDSNNKLDL